MGFYEVPPITSVTSQVGDHTNTVVLPSESDDVRGVQSLGMLLESRHLDTSQAER